jgi:L,D-transpeptidase ErfK/SrfK
MLLRLIAVLVTLSTAIVAALAQDASVESVIVGGKFAYDVRAGDTVTGIGARFGIATVDVIESNHLAKPFVLVPGQSLTLDNTHLAVIDRRVAITINIPQRLLLFAENEQVHSYPITVGRKTWPTPVGAFTIVEKELDPVWDVPVSIQREMAAQGKPVVTRMAASSHNPLGAHWLRLSLPGLGIHGTNAPSSIYGFASHGCIRLHPDDVATLFALVSEGTTGVLVYQPVIVALIGGRLWIEANPDTYQRGPGADQFVRAAARRYEFAERVDWKAVDMALRLRRGRPVDVTKSE